MDRARKTIHYQSDGNRREDDIDSSQSPSTANIINTSTRSSPDSIHPLPKLHPAAPSAHPLLIDSNHESFDHLERVPDHEPVGVFLQRVGKIPLVSGVVRAYERGKDTSKMVRYGADLVESSVNSFSDTVVSKVGPERIAQIDRYAGAALDRLGQFSQLQQTSTHEIHHHHHHHHHHHYLLRHSHLDHLDPDQHLLDHSSPLEQPSSFHHRQSSHISTIHDDQISDHLIYSNSIDSFDEFQPQALDHSFQTSDDQLHPHHIHHQTALHPHSPLHPHPFVQVSTASTNSGSGKSRWQNILVEAGLTAGGIGAAVSEESMKSLQYCLHWLHYASAHLDHQITALRNFISSLNEEEEEASLTYGMRTIEAVNRLASIKREVVETIRKVVDVVSKYARVGLPEPAKEFVRKSILGLPLRWASAIRVTPFIKCSPDSNSRKRNLSPIDQTQTRLPHTNHPHPPTQIAAHRVLTFAVESLNMLKSITGTFSESVERADAWVERLRLIGFQTRHNQDPDHREQQRHCRWENHWGDNEGEEDEIITGKMDKNGKESSNSTRRKGSYPRSRSLGRYQPIPQIRSRNSSRSSSSTFEEDNLSLISEKSMSSSCCGCDLSTVESGSLISSNHTTTPTFSYTFNNNQLVDQDLFPGGSVDRSAAKRRKANENFIHNLQPIIFDPHSSSLSPSQKIDFRKACFSSRADDEAMGDDEEGTPNNPQDLRLDHLAHPGEIQVSHPSLVDPREDREPYLIQHHSIGHIHSLSSTSIISTPSSNLTLSKSLKKILLDPDHVHYLDLEATHASPSAENQSHHIDQIS